MTYGEITIEEARKCCKTFKKECEKCPLRRTRLDDKNKEHTLVCNYVLRSLLDETDIDNILKLENVSHEEEWVKYLESVE